MRSEQIHIGLTLRVIRDRWDVPAGTFARVEAVSQAGVPPLWCFRCEWLFMDGRLRRSTRSLNLFEEDLADFEPFTGPLPVPPSPQKPGRMKARKWTTSSEQLGLPFSDPEAYYIGRYKD